MESLLNSSLDSGDGRIPTTQIWFHNASAWQRGQVDVLGLLWSQLSLVRASLHPKTQTLTMFLRLPERSMVCQNNSLSQTREKNTAAGPMGMLALP